VNKLQKQSLDTNAVLRFLLDDIPAQRKLVENLIEDKSIRFMIADIAIMEIVFVLESNYKFSREQIKTTLTLLNKVSNLSYSKTIFDKAIDKYLEHPALSFDDCFLLAQAINNESLPLWTFDKKLVRQGEGAKEIR
jgi:predicted nucleic-acid-binding protein